MEQKNVHSYLIAENVLGIYEHASVGPSKRFRANSYWYSVSLILT